MTDQQKSKLYQSGWSKWEKFPDPLKGEYLNAPFGPGVYQLKNSKTGEFVLFGKGKNVAHRMSSLHEQGPKERNNQDKVEYVTKNIDDIIYRTMPFKALCTPGCGCNSKKNPCPNRGNCDAIEFEKYVQEREIYVFPEKKSKPSSKHLFSRENLEKANKKFRYLELCLDACDNFLIMGDPKDELMDLAESMGYQVINVQLRSINPDLRGTPVIGNVSGIPCFNYHVPWADPIFEHPDKKFLVVFYIEEADSRAINALKSIIEAHDIQGHRADNFFVGVVCRDANKKIQSTILPLLTRINWID